MSYCLVMSIADVTGEVVHLVDADTGVPFDTFAARLAIVRVALGGVNVKAAAEMCGIEPVTWRRWEQGRKPRDYESNARRIARRARVSEDWLFRGGPLVIASSPWNSLCVDQFELPFPDCVVVPMATPRARARRHAPVRRSA